MCKPELWQDQTALKAWFFIDSRARLAKNSGPALVMPYPNLTSLTCICLRHPWPHSKSNQVKFLEFKPKISKEMTIFFWQSLVFKISRKQDGGNRNFPSITFLFPFWWIPSLIIVTKEYIFSQQFSLFSRQKAHFPQKPFHFHHIKF